MNRTITRPIVEPITTSVVKIYLKGIEVFDYKIVFVATEFIETFEIALKYSSYKRLLYLNLSPEVANNKAELGNMFADALLLLDSGSMKQIGNKPYEYFLNDRKSIFEILRPNKNKNT